MAIFWILAAGMALAVATALVLALLRGRRATGPAEAFDLQVYRDQLDEIGRDLTRGTIPPEEAERLRTEVSRRLLAADAKAQATTAPGAARAPAGLALAAVLALAVVGGGLGLYWRLGAPGYPDLPLQGRIAMAAERMTTRPGQAEAEAQVPAEPAAAVDPQYAALVEKLRSTVADRPGDLQGQRLLARTEAALGNYRASYEAQQRILSIKGDDATAQDYADLADMMILAAGGYVSPEAQRALEAALARDPQSGVARYYGGLMMAQTGRPDLAFRMWDRLLREGPPDAPWIAPVRAQIEEMAFRAGVSDYALPEAPGAPGPTQQDIEAAGEMSAEDRMEMVRGMVAQLSDRLATEGGSAEEWARLINALGVLGETEQARAIWTEAQAVFAGQPEALAQVEAAARGAGLAE